MHLTINIDDVFESAVLFILLLILFNDLDPQINSSRLRSVPLITITDAAAASWCQSFLPLFSRTSLCLSGKPEPQPDPEPPSFDYKNATFDEL
ncbi:hypothetical protein FIE12Z_3003 [Fusarium flagelliforme]|uniref:Uncharacterized protein n=1 Tax=Fusarium flagelliforme TaxID=2675880 RepID=A0A395MYM0_9HYPO|nr:hypothetical protein FIE12Z_3003 [Fusarium flagelliforme]